MILYVGIQQKFRIWFIPYYKADTKLVTKLHLTHVRESPDMETPKGKSKEKVSEASTDAGILKQSRNTSSSSRSSDAKPLLSRSESVSVVEQPLPTPPSEKYYIRSQHELYQTDELVKFLLPWGIGLQGVFFWQIIATVLCVLGALVLRLPRWVKNKFFPRRQTASVAGSGPAPVAEPVPESVAEGMPGPVTEEEPVWAPVPNGGSNVSPNNGSNVSPNGGFNVSPNNGSNVSPNGGFNVSPDAGSNNGSPNSRSNFGSKKRPWRKLDTRAGPGLR